MSKISWNIVLGLLVFAILSTGFFGVVAGAGSDSVVQNVITSSATGELKVTPDRGEISVSVQTQNPDVKVAQADNAKIMNDVMVALTNAGISKDDLKTSGYSIYPVYNDNTNPFVKNVKYYQVTNTLVITVKDISKTGDLTDLCVTNGANQVNYISFMLAPETEQSYRSAALTKAVQQTRADADAVAAALGVNITGVSDATIGSSQPPIMYNNVIAPQAASMGSASTTPIAPGDVTVSASVTVSYLFK